jgi:Ca2+/H+ antiporter
VAGIVLIVVFAIYIFSVVWAIGQSILVAPEDSDSDSDTDGDSGEEPAAPSGSAADHERTETDPLLSRAESAETASLARTSGRRSITYHIVYLVFGFAAICLAGYILSHAASSIASAAGISDVLFGVIILAITTTLPEKFVAVMSGHRGQPGILIANTVGSNIFLLTLCLGITMLDVSLYSNIEHSTVGMAELAVLWGSTIWLVLTVWMGGPFHRFTGVAMLVAYVAFIVLEFTVFHMPREVV